MQSENNRCVRPLICPVCDGDLTTVGSALQCPRAHSFDIAREGYVNLLLAGRRRRKVLGDTRDMLQARRAFLDRGFYSPLSDAINEQVSDHLVNSSVHSGALPSQCVVEVGCGEGYYIGRLKDHLDGQLPPNTTACYFGLDISKEAARLAAKRYKAIRFVVADLKTRVLFSTGSVRVLLNVFAPRNETEFDRVMAKDGVLLVAIPSPDHLKDLRADLNLLDLEANKEQRVIEQLDGAFELAGKHTIEHEILLNGEELLTLVQMTPNYWHISDDVWNDIKAMDGIRTRACFTVLRFRR